jgi:4'-phosphopantetheinyl transferase
VLVYSNELHIPWYKGRFFAKSFISNEPSIDFSIAHSNIYDNEYHKPLIDGINFNISHSNNLILIGISNNNIGLDIEMVNPTKDLTLLKKKIFNDESIDNEILIKNWTKIEATFKYDGTGIIYSDLKDEKIKDKTFENIQTFEIHDSFNNKYYYSIKLKEKEKIESNVIH